MTLREGARAFRVAAVLAARGAAALPAVLLRRRPAPMARALVGAFERLGPAYVKLGQFLSVREDLMGPAASGEFARLQDQAAPLPFPLVREVVERELCAPLDRFFTRFDPRPLASASVSQVHRAALPDGSEVAVKVQRPRAAEEMARDLAILRRAASLAHRLPFLRRHVDLRAFVAEVERSSAQELDFRREAEIAERFARNFRGTAGVRIPRVHWRLTSRCLLVTEYVEGRKISDLSLRGREEYPELAERGALLFFRQVLGHGLFHADLHPANLLVTPAGEIAYLDFGIWGEIGPEERHAVVGALTGLLCRDGRLALRHLARMGVEVEAERAEPFVVDVRRALEEGMGPTLGEVDAARIGRRILAAARRHRVRFPHKYALLVKALLTIEGAARTLHGGFDPERAARAYLTEWLKSEARPSLAIEGIWRTALLGAVLYQPDPEGPSPTPA